MKRTKFKSVIEVLIFLLCAALTIPATVLYILGLPFLLVVNAGHLALPFTIPLAGYGLFSTWGLIAYLDEYADYGAPFHVYPGVISGTIALIIINNSFGFDNPINTFIENSFFAIFIGWGPLIASSMSIMLIAVSRSRIRRQQQ